MKEQKFSKDGIFNHQLGIHNYDSFGRSVVYQALEMAKEIIANQKEATDKVTVEMNFRVEMWGDDTKCHKVGHGTGGDGHTWISVNEV